MLGVETNVVFAYFSFACITGPVGGMIFGGAVTARLGGFNSKKAIIISFIMLSIACLAGSPLPFINTFWIFAIDMWFLLFVGAFAIPTLTGMMLASVSERDRTSANSLSQFLNNSLGFLPAPAVYGQVQALTGGETSRWGLIFTCGFTYISIMLFAAASIYKFRKLKKANEIGYE